MYRVMSVCLSDQYSSNSLNHNEESFVYIQVMLEELMDNFTVDFLSEYDAVLINEDVENALEIAAKVIEVERTISVVIMSDAEHIIAERKRYGSECHKNEKITLLDLDKTDALDDFLMLKIKRTVQSRSNAKLNKLLSEKSMQSHMSSQDLAAKDLCDIKDPGSTFDSLTGFPNRISFIAILSDKMIKAKEDKHGFSLLIANIDSFHLINEIYSEEDGNLILKDVAQILAKVFEEAVISRINADEFIIILDETANNKIDAAVESLFLSLNKYSVYKELPYRLNLSVAILKYCWNYQLNFENIMQYLHSALDAAKKTNDNSVAYFSSLDNPYSFKMELQHKFFEAIKEDRFMLVYQPVIDIKNHSILYFEVLIRWEEGGTMYPPDRFIPVLERLDLVYKLDLWVLKKITKELPKLQDRVSKRVSLGINVTPGSLQRDAVIDGLKILSDMNQISLSNIYIEVIESCKIEKTNDFVGKLILEKIPGINFILDDFGDGYSQLYRLTQLPVFALKIDMSFIQGIGVNKKLEKIINIILNIGNIIGSKVIAEGVETKEQLDFLIQHGCRYIQGYYFFKAMCLDDLTVDEKLQSYLD